MLNISKPAYFACSYQHREQYRELWQLLKTKLVELDIGVVAPVFDFTDINPDDHHLIMAKSFELLSASQALIAEASHKNIGIGIEVGFAKAIHLPILYLRQINAPISTTMLGTASESQSYQDRVDAIQLISKWLKL